MVRDAQIIIEVMIDKDHHPNTVMFNALSRMQDLKDKALEMLDVVVANGCAPNIITYTSLINGFSKQRQMDDAMNLLTEVS